MSPGDWKSGTGEVGKDVWEWLNGHHPQAMLSNHSLRQNYSPLKTVDPQKKTHSSVLRDRWWTCLLITTQADRRHELLNWTKSGRQVLCEI